MKKKKKKAVKGMKGEQASSLPTFELRIPAQEQYAYLNTHFTGTAEDAITEYRRLTALMTGGMGMDTRDFNKVLDKYLWGDGQMTPDEWDKMNISQQEMIQEIKRSRARNKNN